MSDFDFSKKRDVFALFGGKKDLGISVNKPLPEAAVVNAVLPPENADTTPSENSTVAGQAAGFDVSANAAPPTAEDISSDDHAASSSAPSDSEAVTPPDNAQDSEREREMRARAEADIASLETEDAEVPSVIAFPASDGWVKVPLAMQWEGRRRFDLFVTKDYLAAGVFIHHPPKDERETLTLDLIYTILNKNKIVFGLDKEAIQSLITGDKTPLYDCGVVVARGIAPTQGSNGVVTEFFPRTNAPRFEERADGSIDFKNLHIVNNVHKDTVICEITNSVNGTAGTSIYGKPINPRPVRMPPIPRGENVTQVEAGPQGSRLIAAIDGNLIYKNQRFCVESTFKVDGNVDNSVGNINFTGNVIVTGDVFEGYSIKTDNDVTIYGVVEGATIYAGGNIHIEKGVLGMQKGLLSAKKDITVKFIESCNVMAGGNITSESIVNSNVESDKDITLTGRGTIVGGTITSFGSIKANTVGSKGGTPTNIVLGTTSSILRERNSVRQQYQKIMQEYQSLQNDILFLKEKNYTKDLSDKLEQRQSRLNLVLYKKVRLERQIAEFTAQEHEVINSTLTCRVAYPPLRVTIANSSLRLQAVENMCFFYQNSEGCVVLGHV